MSILLPVVGFAGFLLAFLLFGRRLRSYPARYWPAAGVGLVGYVVAASLTYGAAVVIA
jgi:hypothetical protein